MKSLMDTGNKPAEQTDWEVLHGATTSTAR